MQTLDKVHVHVVPCVDALPPSSHDISVLPPHQYLNLLEAELQKLSAECESSTGVWMDLRGDPNATSAQAKFGSPSKLTIAYFSGEVRRPFHLCYSSNLWALDERDLESCWQDDDDDIHLEDYNAMMEYDPTIESQEEIHNVNPMYSPYGNPHGVCVCFLNALMRVSVRWECHCLLILGGEGRRDVCVCGICMRTRESVCNGCMSACKLGGTQFLAT